MSIVVKKAKNLIVEAVEKAFKTAIEKGLLPEGEHAPVIIEVPADSAHGDYSTNAAMASARVFRMAPVKIAEIVRDCIVTDGTYIASCETAGPGFLNFRLNSDYYSDILKDALEKKEQYGHSDIGKGQSVLVEFVSANPTGPMHIGNARGGALGDVLSEILIWAGYRTEREFYVNDAGNQIEKFGLSLDIRYRQIFDPSIEMPEDAYLGQDIIDHAKAFYEQYGDKYLNVPDEERKKALIDFALPKNIKALEEDLLKYRIKYDNWFRESTVHANGSVQRVLKLLKESGYTYEKDGALWFMAEKFGCDKDFVLVRSNGIPTYIVPDIAYHYNKLVERGFDRAINILGADHHGYVPRLKAALQAIGIDPERLIVILMQMVRLVRGGEVVKASKRSGKAITLVTLLEEVPIDAARFFFNLREANTHLDFDLDLAVENSSKNPVYYCQYAHARICSIIKRVSARLDEIKTEPKFELLDTPEERELIKHIASLTEEIEFAAKNLDPSRITKYAIDLATAFHKFYNANRVDVEDKDLFKARLCLCIAVRDVMKNILNMMKVDAPEVM